MGEKHRGHVCKGEKGTYTQRSLFTMCHLNFKILTMKNHLHNSHWKSSFPQISLLNEQHSILAQDTSLTFHHKYAQEGHKVQSTHHESQGGNRSKPGLRQSQQNWQQGKSQKLRNASKSGPSWELVTNRHSPSFWRLGFSCFLFSKL